MRKERKFSRKGKGAAAARKKNAEDAKFFLLICSIGSCYKPCQADKIMAHSKLKKLCGSLPNSVHPRGVRSV